MLRRLATQATPPLRRAAHTLGNDKYMRTPESFQAVLARFAKDKACAVLRTPTAGEGEDGARETERSRERDAAQTAKC